MARLVLLLALTATLVSGCVGTVFDGGVHTGTAAAAPSPTPELDAHTRRLGI